MKVVESDQILQGKRIKIGNIIIIGTKQSDKVQYAV